MTPTTGNQSDHSATSTCYMAIELSNTSWLIGMMTPLSDKISLRKIDSGAVQQLMEIIDRTIERVSRGLGGRHRSCRVMKPDMMVSGCIGCSRDEES